MRNTLPIDLYHTIVYVLAIIIVDGCQTPTHRYMVIIPFMSLVVGWPRHLGRQDLHLPLLCWGNHFCKIFF